jgi:carbon starvation protein
MALLALGVLFAHPAIVAPAWNPAPAGAPPFWALFFVTIACGAISGFHSLVGSGTTSKQIRNETDSCMIGYGSMLLEGMLAVFVIIAVAAGIGMATGEGPSGVEAWQAHYVDWNAAKGLGAKLGAFVKGSGNMLTAVGIPIELALAIMSVFVASFAATTLDTSIRIQRYVVGELGAAVKVKPLTSRHGASIAAVVTAGALALADGSGKGGLVLWPLFGATNQLIACLALLVVTTYLKRRNKPVHYTIIPAAFMFVVTGLAMGYNIYTFGKPLFGPVVSFGTLHLLLTGVVVVGIEMWMIVEAVKVIFGRGEAPRP